MVDYYRINDGKEQQSLHYSIGVFIEEIELSIAFKDRIYGRLADSILAVEQKNPEMIEGRFDIFSPATYQLDGFVKNMDEVSLYTVKDLNDFNMNPPLINFHIWTTTDTLQNCYAVYLYATQILRVFTTFEILGTLEEQKKLEIMLKDRNL